MNEGIKTRIKIHPYCSWGDEKEETIKIVLGDEEPTVSSDIKWSQDDDPQEYDTFEDLREAVRKREFVEGDTLSLFMIKKEGDTPYKEEIPIEVKKSPYTINISNQMKKLGLRS